MSFEHALFKHNPDGSLGDQMTPWLGADVQAQTISPPVTLAAGPYVWVTRLPADAKIIRNISASEPRA